MQNDTLTVTLWFQSEILKLMNEPDPMKKAEKMTILAQEYDKRLRAITG